MMSETLYAVGQFTFRNQAQLNKGMQAFNLQTEEHGLTSQVWEVEGCSAWIRLQAQVPSVGLSYEDAFRAIAQHADTGHVDLRLRTHPQVRRFLSGGTPQRLLMPQLATNPRRVAALLHFRTPSECQSALKQFARRARFPVFAEEGWLEYIVSQDLWHVQGTQARLNIQLNLPRDMEDWLLRLFQQLARNAEGGTLDFGLPESYVRWHTAMGCLQESLPEHFAKDVLPLPCQSLRPVFSGAEQPLAEPLALFCEKNPQSAETHPLPVVFSGATGHVQGCIEIDSERLLSWSMKSIQLWDRLSGELLFQQPFSCWSIAGVRCLPDGRFAIWHALSGDIHLWDPDTYILSSFAAHEHTVYDLCVLRKDTLVSCSLDGTIRIWDYPSLRLQNTVVLAKDPVKQITALSSREILLSNPPYGDTTLIWNVESHENSWEILANHAQVHPSGLWVSEYFGQFSVWSDTRTLMSQWTRELGVQHSIHFLPDEQLLLHQPSSAQLMIVDLHSGQLQRAFHAHSQPIQNVAPAGQGRWLSYARESISRSEADHSLKMWREGFWEEGWSIDVGAPILDTLLLPQDQVLIIRQDPVLGQTMPVYDLNTGEQVRLLSGHKEPVNGARLSLDGRVLSWSQDRTLRHWSLPEQAE